MVGFLEKTAEPVTFLTVGEIKNYVAYNRSVAGFIIEMSQKKNFYTRNAYTLLSLLGDFGGFNDAIVFLISILMSSYSAKMYAAQITAELPFLTEPSKASIQAISTL